MNRINAALFCAGLLFFAVACTIVLDKRYINPIQPPPGQIPISVDIQDPNFQDPFPLTSTTEFHFKIDAAKPVTAVNVLVDGAVIPATGTNAIQFTLNPAALADGTHAVQIQILIDSQSGSLLNHLGGEFYQTEMEFKVTVDRTLPLVDSPTASIEDGYMTLRWSFPPKGSFNYQITVYRLSGYNDLTFIRRKILVTPKQPVFVDSGFVGGHNKYELYISNFAGDRYQGAAEVHVSPAKFSIEIDPNHASRLVWTPNFTNASFTVIANSGSRTISLATGSIACDSLYLGDRKSYHLYVQRHGYPLQYYDSVMTLKSSPNLPVFTDLKVLPTQSKALLLSHWDIYRVDLPGFSKEDSISKYISFGVYPPAAILASANGLHAAFSYGTGSLIQFNPLDFSQRKVFRPSLELPDHSYSPLNITAASHPSDNGLLGLNHLFGTPTPALGDLTVDTDVSPLNAVVWTDLPNPNVPQVSSDGKYFSVMSTDGSAGQVYTDNSGSWTLLGKVAAGEYFFRNNSSTELISIGSSIEIYDLSSTSPGNGFFQPVRTLNYSALSGGLPIEKVGYDAPSQAIYIETIDQEYYSTIKTYDIASFVHLATAVAYVPPAVPFATKHFYSNNYHFLTSGFGEKIK